MASFVSTHTQPYAALSPTLPGRSLAGKSAFITGAGRGVGEHITRGIAAAGIERIGLLGRDKARIEKAKEAFAKEFPAVIFEAYAADITDGPAITAVFKAFGPADILVNNAGQFPDDGLFIDQDLKKWWSGWEANVLGTAIVSQKFLQALGPGKKAVVLTVTSMAAHMRFPVLGWSGYNASKLAQARIFESIRFEHPDVRFVNVHPGVIESDGFTGSGAPVPPGGMTEGKMAGDFFAWLSTDEAEFLSGRFVWAEWDVEELKARKDEILEKDLLLTTIDGFVKGQLSTTIQSCAYTSIENKEHFSAWAEAVLRYLDNDDRAKIPQHEQFGMIGEICLLVITASSNIQSGRYEPSEYVQVLSTQLREGWSEEAMQHLAAMLAEIGRYDVKETILLLIPSLIGIVEDGEEFRAQHEALLAAALAERPDDMELRELCMIVYAVKLSYSGFTYVGDLSQSIGKEISRPRAARAKKICEGGEGEDETEREGGEGEEPL
ncbi:MAG: hypothetical protein MMC33_005262 [Icmadophila ericetorum]|nr:hypothetical protein [Icmadophila ericetorum]